MFGIVGIVSICWKSIFISEKKNLKKICFKKRPYLDSLPETHLHTARKSIARRAISLGRYQHIISNYQYPQYFISTLSAIISTHSKNHSKYQQLSVPTVIISTNSKNISTLSVIISTNSTISAIISKKWHSQYILRPVVSRQKLYHIARKASSFARQYKFPLYCPLHFLPLGEASSRSFAWVLSKCLAPVQQRHPPFLTTSTVVHGRNHVHTQGSEEALPDTGLPPNTRVTAFLPICNV